MALYTMCTKAHLYAYNMLKTHGLKIEIKQIKKSCVAIIILIVVHSIHYVLDTEPLYSGVFQNILDDYGKTYTWEVKQTLMGCQAVETAQAMVSAYDLPITWQEFAARSKAMTSELMANAQLLPGKHWQKNRFN